MGFSKDAGEEIVQDGPPRDRWGRPLLIPADKSIPVDKNGRAWYSRASSMSDYASGVKTGLEVWRRRKAGVGVAQREDIAAMIAALPPLDTGDKVNDDITKQQLDEYLEMAQDHAGQHDGANHGTAVHGFTEAAENPHNPHVPERMRDDVDAYYAHLEKLGIKVIATEVFVANDGARTAGTFDHLYLLPDMRVVVADKKTGKPNLHDALIQMATYSYGDVYDWRTDERTSLEDIAEAVGGTLDRSMGLHVHIADGACKVTPLNTGEGYRLLLKAAALRDSGLAANRERWLAGTEMQFILHRVHTAKSQAELETVMDGIDDEDAREAARKRWRELA